MTDTRRFSVHTDGGDCLSGSGMAQPDLTSTRRSAMMGLALLPTLAGLGLAPSPARGESTSASSKSLVAFFTRTGNTRVIACQIKRATASDIAEITPAMPYPEDYEDTVAQARRETESGYLPALTAINADPGRYDTLYLGFPIWGTTMPPAVRAFLADHDLSGKLVFPFITHGGYGVGNALAILAERAPNAQLADAFVLEADQERRTLEKVTSWLADAAP